MSLSKNKERKIGVILQYAQMALNIIIQLVYIPILLRTLGQNEYGIYNLASSIIAYLSLLSLGFGSSYLRYYSIYKKNDDNEGIKKLNGLYLLVFTIIGLISLTLGLYLSHNVSLFYNETYSSEDIKIAKTLMIFLTINMSFSFPASVFTSYITSQERFVFQKIINLGKTIIAPIVNIAVLFFGFGSIGMVVCTTIISIFIDCVNMLFCFTKLKMKVSFLNPNFMLLKDIFVFSIFIAVNQIIDQINWQTDKIILGKMINGTAVAIYSVGASINTMFVSFSTAISSVYAPKINMIVSKNDSSMNNELTSLFIKVGRIQWFLLSLILQGFIFFGEFFILKWAGPGYESSYWVALLLIAPMIIPGCQTLGIEIQRAKNKHQIRSIVYLIMAIINVFISIWLASLWGEIGCALGTTISLVLGPCIFMNYYYNYGLGLNIKMFWKTILKTLVAFIIPVFLGILIKTFYTFSSLIDFSLLVCLYILVYCISIFLFGLNNEEKGAITSLLARIVGGEKATI